MKAAPAVKRRRSSDEIPQHEELEFEPLSHSVYDGRQRLGHYVRIAHRQYAAYDARNRPLGKFASTGAAFAAVGRKRRFARRSVQ